MTQRIVLALDVTFDEARLIAERMGDAASFHGAFNLPIMIDEAEEFVTEPGKVKHLMMRSEASAALGGPSATVTRLKD